MKDSNKYNSRIDPTYEVYSALRLDFVIEFFHIANQKTMASKWFRAYEMLPQVMTCIDFNKSIIIGVIIIMYYVCTMYGIISIN